MCCGAIAAPLVVAVIFGSLFPDAQTMAATMAGLFVVLGAAGTAMILVGNKRARIEVLVEPLDEEEW